MALAELQDLVRRHAFWKNRLRPNIGESEATKYAGRRMLVNPVLSNSIHEPTRTKAHARMLALAQEMLGEHITHLTINKDVCCARHRDGRNAGSSSHITFFGPEGADYEGGELVLEEEGGDRVLSERNVWHSFDGRNTWHYNKAHTGTKFSVVAYQRKDAPAATKRGKRREVTDAAHQDV
jgi:hypothetical protein